MTTTDAIFTAWGVVVPDPPPVSERERVARLVYEVVRRFHGWRGLPAWEEIPVSRVVYFAVADAVIADRTRAAPTVDEGKESPPCPPSA